MEVTHSHACVVSHHPAAPARLVRAVSNGSRWRLDPQAPKESLALQLSSERHDSSTHRLVPTTQADLCIDSAMPALPDMKGSQRPVPTKSAGRQTPTQAFSLDLPALISGSMPSLRSVKSDHGWL